MLILSFSGQKRMVALPIIIKNSCALMDFKCAPDIHEFGLCLHVHVRSQVIDASEYDTCGFTTMPS